MKKISITAEGYIHCKSRFYSVNDNVSADTKYDFTVGLNKSVCEIDSGNWAVSYLMSMYIHSAKDFVLFRQPQIKVDSKSTTIEELSQKSCYMDTLYPLFSKKTPVHKLVAKGIKINKLDTTAENIRELFCIDKERFTRPLSGVGNEIFKAMAAIGYVNKKEVFCFPWMSHKRFESYHANLTEVLRILEDLNSVIVLPVGREDIN